MPDDPATRHSAFLHELAEGLQTTGSYLAAARRLIDSDSATQRASASDVIERAVDQLSRAQAAFHRLRGHLSERESDDKASLASSSD